MADNSSNNSSGPRNWRDRVGVKGEMPKLADEFRTEPKISTPPAPATVTASVPEKPRQPAAATPAPTAARPAPTPINRPVARTAPMAPRRPAPTPVKPADPVSRAASDAANERSNAFAERLRAQREAAETLAKKRSDETRNRLSGAGSTGSGPRFSFAEEELKAATTEKPVSAPVRPQVAQAPAAPKRTTPPSPSSSPPPRAPFRPTQSASTPPAYQPSDAYRQTHGYREYDNQPTTPPAPVAPATTGHERYADTPTGDQPSYTPPSRSGYRAPQTRDPYYADDAADDLFDDGQEQGRAPARPAPRRAGASDYSAAYRDYDDAFDYDEEPRSRGGIWVFVVLMLIVVAAIAAGAYWFINYGTKIGTNTPANGNVPTVTAPDKPVKVAPKPADTTTTPGAPVRRKKIYDRILGNETLEPEKLVPSEETPKVVPPPVVPQVAPTGDAPLGVQPLPLPLPPPPTIPGVQGGLQDGAPGAVSGKTNRVASLTPGAGKTGQTVIAPTAAPQTTTTQTGGQQAPLALPPVIPETTPPVATQDTKPAPPLPRSKPAIIIARARQAAEQSRLAALTRSVTPQAPAVPVAPRQPLTSTGPVQLSPGTSGGQNFNSPTTPRQPNTNIASLPQPRLPASPPVTAPQRAPAAGTGYVLQMATFRDRNAASAEYRRLISRHASILRGLTPEIREGDLGVSGKFYKLRLGSVANRGQASQLCNALIAAGEKDCLVRSR